MNIKCNIRTSKLRCSGAQWGQECEQQLWKFKQLPTKFCWQLLIFLAFASNVSVGGSFEVKDRETIKAQKITVDPVQP